VPAAGAVLAIIEGLQAAWGTVSRVIQAFDRFMGFLKAVKTGQSGPQFGAALAAAGVVLIDFVSNWLLKRVRGAASKVAGKVKEIAKKIGRKLKAATKKLGGKFGKAKDKFFGKEKGEKGKGKESDRKDNKDKKGKDEVAEKRTRLDNALDAAVAAVNRFADKPVGKVALKPILYAIKLRYGLKVLEPVKDGDYWAVHGKINPENTRPTRVLVVGDNTFEYSRALRDKLDREGKNENTHITATGIESQKEVENLLKKVKEDEFKKFPESRDNYQVRHGVDATRLQDHFPNLPEEDKFDKIIFNNPQAGKKGTDNVDEKTGQLINNVLASSPHVLQPGGEVHFGVTSTSKALGVSKLQQFLTEAQQNGHVVINGKRFEVEVVKEVKKANKGKYEFAVDYDARRTEGGSLRGSRGPSNYYKFKLIGDILS
jgi:hypothetical protein